MKNKHLKFDDRLEIEKGLKNNESFKFIANNIGKNCTTISREIKSHFIIKNTGALGRAFNNCNKRNGCPNRHYCNLKKCSDYIEEKCDKLNKPPYVCNGCNKKYNCTLTKRIYDANYAQKEYENYLSETRSGITFSEEEIKNLNTILKPLIIDQKQSIHSACVNNKDKIMCSEKQIYNLIDAGILDIKNIDLPRKVRYRERRKSRTTYKIDKQCLLNRKYSDYLKYIEENPDTALVQMDTVEGCKGGKVLLTIHFVSCSFMLAFIRENNDSQSVIYIFNRIQDKIGLENFKKLFPIILTDNGSEFSNPKKIEYDSNGNQRTKIFYCEPSKPNQKGSCEVNHEMIRKFFEKGESFNNYNQENISLMMSHINSYPRKKLNNKTPLTLFNLIYGNQLADKLGIIEIEANSVYLTKKIYKNTKSS